MGIHRTKFGREIAKNEHGRQQSRHDRADTNDEPNLIFSCSITELSGKCLDITPYASPCRFRMLSCLSLEHENRLDVFEFDQLPSGEYCAVSYVWRGVPVPDYVDSGTFTVRGAEDGDPTSLDVLRDIVWVAGEEGKKYLWLDRIGIVQSDKSDKAWQIIQMFNIYKESTCIIVPGGLGRLAFSNDDTTWMDRAWTLQEALAPKRDDAIVLYSQNPSLQFETHVASLSFIDTREKPLRSGRTSVLAAYMTLDDVLTVAKYSIHRPFGFNQAHAQPLIGARITGVGQRQAIWQCALMRTSSRPVDMIFSVMHFFGILLNPKEFEDDDRLGVTVRFAQGSWKTHERVYWTTRTIGYARCILWRRLNKCPHFPMFATRSKSVSVVQRLSFGVPLEVLENDWMGDFPVCSGGMRYFVDATYAAMKMLTE